MPWFFCAAMVLAAWASSAQSSGELRVSENGRFLVHADGSPFFYLGDTAWELFHRLDREEAARYLTDRAAKGFTVIQAVVVAELSGLTKGNAYGEVPFVDLDVSRPNEAYFAHVDWIVDRAERLGLYIGMLPSWGRWVGKNDANKEHNNFFNETNAFAYGRFLGERYRGRPIIWILGGDREAVTSKPVWDAMAAGIRAAVGRSQLISYHPRTASSKDFHDAPWLDFNMIQSGHSAESINYGAIERDYALLPPKPCMDAEPAYEYPPDAMPPRRPVGAVQVRRNAYWSVFAGAHGHTYGTHPIWQMYDEGREPRWDVTTPWHQALDLPGAMQLGFLKQLMLSRPYLTRIPDQSLIVSEAPQGLERVQVTRDGTAGGQDATYIFAYFPSQTPVTLDTSVIPGDTLRVTWMNPRNGTQTAMGTLSNAGKMDLLPPEGGPGIDWVAIIDDAAVR